MKHQHRSFKLLQLQGYIFPTNEEREYGILDCISCGHCYSIFMRCAFSASTSHLQAIYKNDPLLEGFRDHLDYRWAQYCQTKERIVEAEGSLSQFARVRKSAQCHSHQLVHMHASAGAGPQSRLHFMAQLLQRFALAGVRMSCWVHSIQ